MRSSILALLVSAPLLAQPALNSTKTQSIDFPAAGTIHLRNSTGALTIEAWDKPTVELTTTKSEKPGLHPKARSKASTEFDQIAFTTDRKGNELTIATATPKHLRHIDIAYHLWVPRDTRLSIDHNNGELNIEGVTANIEATLRHGQIFIYLPAGETVSTTATAKIGNIYVPGDPTLKPLHFKLGQTLSQAASDNAPKLDLKIGFGDIYILNSSPLTAQAANLPRESAH